MSPGRYTLMSADFTPVPSQEAGASVVVDVVVDQAPAALDAIGYVVGPEDDPPAAAGIGREALAALGFEGKPGQSILLPRGDGPQVVLVGAGPADGQNEDTLRDAAATFARAAHRLARIAFLPGAFPVAAEAVGRVVTEGVLLARYRYTALKPTSTHVPLVSLAIVVDEAAHEGATRGARIGRRLALATVLARDLANTPASHLTAADLAKVAVRLGAEHGVTVETFDKEQIIELGCGGLLGVNAGSVEEPRMIKLSYVPITPDGSPLADPPLLAIVGKGIMYDSGGISLKPSDQMHLLMKMDMAGAAAVLAAMTALRDLDCRSAVTAWLMCTDNMPSGSAMKLGDVLSIRGGKTVEVKNTDAEGRLVMSDALVLASEESPDAIIDIATLTGAALMALGAHTAAVLGNNQDLVDQAIVASRRTGESIWQLPLERRYRPQLDSEVADLSNLAGPHAGATTAALFLAEFVGDIPWAHIDIAGTMQAEKDDYWRTVGATGFGARLLIDLALNFEPVS